MKIPFWLRIIFANRRKEKRPVDKDRRGGGGGTGGKHRQADERLRNAIDDLERTVSIKRDDILKYSANDRQQVVIFSTFREICDHKLDAGEHRLCRHPEHEAANSGIARCEEQICPLLDKALKGAA